MDGRKNNFYTSGRIHSSEGTLSFKETRKWVKRKEKKKTRDFSTGYSWTGVSNKRKPERRSLKRRCRPGTGDGCLCQIREISGEGFRKGVE